MSCEPADFRDLVDQVRRAELMMGSAIKAVTPSEADTATAVRRTLLYARRLPAGAILADSDLVALRTGAGGLGPESAFELVGRRLRSPVRSGLPVSEADFE